MQSYLLTDQYRRPIQDLRISVTDRCNFRCSYCMPKEIFGTDCAFMHKDELLSFEEIMRLVSLFASQGVSKIRLTGGEPLLRNDLPVLVAAIKQIPEIKDLGLTTNGTLLGKQAQSLYDAGLRRLNISLDALDPKLFGQMNGRGIPTDHILKQIHYAQQIGFKIKINMVVQKNVNDAEIIPMAQYFKNCGITLRFIEFMDVGNDNSWSFQKVVTKQNILQKLQQSFQLEPIEPTRFGEVAKYYRYAESDAQVGFITSVSESFCSSCTRGRLSSDGTFYNCLFASQGLDLRDLLRHGADDHTLLQAIVQTWTQRKDRYSDERTAQTAVSRPKISMSYIGG
ncbi:Cyclic pyranopterin phosphate synthase [Paenibacillus nuruki]|uniref:GTP 3',8-cyclase n=1 Tax=Paenibacillus nuruki TaxID=1886670 RepID=A0A1E3L2B5_9BACL|nr:GTP 3',8-cyclase MoaA [Paenibacillus nuruki]ODP27908.1 Cyclic pyranopterin phosphate synthase [Paenibacillus nuruki]